VPISTRVEAELANQIEKIAQEEQLDKATVIRRLLKEGTRQWKISKALREYRRGGISQWRAASDCGLSLREMIAIFQREGIEITYSLSDLEEDVKGIMGEE